MAKYAGQFTDWYRWDEHTKDWEFNHRQRGYNPIASAPTPTSDLQRKAWPKMSWKKERVS